MPNVHFLERLLFNCSKVEYSLEALELAEKENLAGKILVDVANPLDFSKGMPPTLYIVNDDSLGKTVQRRFPETKVIKTLNALAALESSASPLSEKIDWVLDIVGDGSQREELQHLAGRLRIAQRVVFHGRISDARVEDVFASANLFLMPAVQGYGLPALEALARGVPVVLHKESGVSEILKENLWVEIIEEDTDDLASAIDTMVDRIMSGELEQSPKPQFPTETGWAHDICLQCKWL